MIGNNRLPVKRILPSKPRAGIFGLGKRVQLTTSWGKNLIKKRYLVSDAYGVDEVEQNLFRSKELLIFENCRGVYGGQLVGQALKAATLTVDPKYVVDSLHSSFFYPGLDKSPVYYSVETMHTSRKFTSRRVDGRQDGKVIFTATILFTTPEHSNIKHQIEIPDVYPPEHYSPGHIFKGIKKMYQFNDKNELSIKEAPGRVELEKRFVGQDKNGMPFSNFIDRKQPLPPRLNWWFKPTGDMKDASIFDKQCAIAYISDYFYIFISLMAHDVGGIQLGDYLKFAASLDHSIWFHRPPTEWPNGNGWILHQMESTVAHGGRGHLASRLFDESGVLLASTAQEGYIMGAEKHFRGDGKVKKLSNYSFAVTH